MGFRVVDALAEAQGATFQDKRYGFVCKTRVKNAELLLLKPSTYMNLSGNAVRYWKEQEGIDIDRILVAVDDIALPFGAIRMRASGSDAGHNGLKDIARALGSSAYPRLRFGIGGDFPRGCQVDYVLGEFPPEQARELPARIEVAVDAIRECVLAGMGSAMCKFNNK